MKVGRNTLAVSGVAVIVAVSIYVFSRRKSDKQRKPIHSSDDSALEQQFHKAAQKAKTLRNMANGDRLMLYGLYKQALQGNRNIAEPSTLHVVAHAKYVAWGKFSGMPQTVAMSKYCEVIEHFSTGGKSIFAPDDDKADIVYPDDDSDADDLEDANNNNQQKSISGLGMKQSTMMAQEEIKRSDGAQLTIHECADEGNLSQLERLIADGIDIDKPDESGQTALHFSADRGHKHCVSMLIKAGANVNASDADGISVLQTAVIGGHVDITRLLLEAGADPDQKDSDGDSPRNFVEEEDEEMVILLKNF